jgi:hypothetical protein
MKVIKNIFIKLFKKTNFFDLSNKRNSKKIIIIKADRAIPDDLGVALSRKISE